MRSTRISRLVLSLGLAGAHAIAQTGAPTKNITVDEAIRLAQINEPGFATAAAESRAAALERKDAAAGLLPTVIFHNQYLYTESNHSRGNGSQGGEVQSLPVFIANNAVHEYVDQGSVNETFGLAGIARARLADASAARAEAELEIARRGVVATVIELYYSVRAESEKLAVAQRALDEANRFVDLTEKRERAGESAHADVIKARLGQQERERELSDARLAREKAGLELGVLLYPDPRIDYTLEEEVPPPVLPDRKDVEAAAGKNNPEIRSALASLRASQAENLTAWAGLLPDLTLNYTYGIDAPQFSSYGPDGVRNRGFSASATVDIPIWDWLTSERKVKEAHIRAAATKVVLSGAERRVLANLEEFYGEAEVAEKQLASLEASAA